jgi:hypothetical protein
MKKNVWTTKCSKSFLGAAVAKWSLDDENQKIPGAYPAKSYKYWFTEIFNHKICKVFTNICSKIFQVIVKIEKIVFGGTQGC